MKIDSSRLERLLDEAALDAVILVDPVSVEYATGHRTWVTREMRGYMVDPAGGFELVSPPMAVLGRGGAAYVVAPAWFAADEASETLAGAYLYQAPTYAVDPVTTSPHLSASGWHARLTAMVESARSHGDPVAALAAAISDLGVDSRRLGIEGLAGPPGLAPAICDRLGLEQIVEATPLIRLLRAVKTPAEIDLLRHVALIAEDVGIDVLRAIAAGEPLNDALRRFRGDVMARGAEVEHFMFSELGVAFSTGRGPTRHLRDEAVAVDWGCALDGYRSDTGHTVVVGRVSDLVHESHAALAECIEYGASLLSPGADPVQVSVEMDGFLEARGVHNANPHGHGIGLDLRDLPIAMRSSSSDVGRGHHLRAVEFESGMIVNLEATALLPPVGAVEVERTFIVGDGGGVALLDQPRSLPITA